MAKSKKYVISREVYKYPYCAKLDDTEDYLSDKVCRGTIKIRKKIVRKTKQVFVRVFIYGNLIFTCGTAVLPTQAIGLPMVPTPIVRSFPSNIALSKPVIIAYAIQMNEHMLVEIECKNNSLSEEQLMAKITNLRGGVDSREIFIALGLIAAMVVLLNNPWNVGGFQPNPNAIVAIVPPHMQWMYGNNYQPGQFGYGKGAGPRSITVTGLARNAGSEKKDPSSGSYNYIDVMKKLEKQSSNNIIEIQVGDQIYRFKNPSRKNADELQFKLAEKIYDSIRKSDTDICDIAENLGFKADNIKNIKDHVFYNEHDLDRYGPDEIEHKRFDATLEQALAWKRLEAGIHTQDDVTWIKHECAERHHELKYDSGYSEAHERAQSRYDGYPWENKF